MHKKRSIFFFCILLSIVFHVCFFSFLQTYSLWFYSQGNQCANLQISQYSELSHKDQILKETFVEVASSPSYLHVLPEPITPLKYQLLESNERPKFETQNSSHPLENELILHVPKITFPLPELLHLNHLAILPDLIIPNTNTSLHSPNFLPFQELSQTISQAPIVFTNNKSQETSSIEFSAKEFIHEEISNPKLPSSAQPQRFSLPQLPSLLDLQTINISDSFDFELFFTQENDGPRYIFVLTLVPETGLELPAIKQNIVFLVDKSNSIQQERLIATKSAITRSLEFLNEHNNFNILTFDSRLDKLFPSLSPLSSETLGKAEIFLEKTTLGSIFFTADLYKPLLLSLPNIASEDELYTAILLTDGESLASKNAEWSLLHDWTKQNQNRLSLYAIGLEQDAHLDSLEALCHFNNGKYITANSHRGLKRKLTKLCKSLSTPVARNISFKAISRNPNLQIQLYSTSSHLYAGQPYVIIGSTNTLDDFILFIQGRLQNSWLNLKKTVSFVNGKKGGNSLRSEWTLQKAHQCILQYVNSGNLEHLAEAKKMLKSIDLPKTLQ